MTDWREGSSVSEGEGGGERSASEGGEGRKGERERFMGRAGRAEGLGAGQSDMRVYLSKV